MHSLTIYSFAALSIMFAISEFAVRIRCKSQRRLDELAQVELLLSDHYDALEHVFNDPAAPEEIREILLWLSDSISNKNRSELIVREVFDKSSSKEDVLETDYDALRRSRPDIVADIEKAISTGFSAMILRWPETSQRSEIFMSEMIRKDKDREIARAVKWAGNNNFGIAMPLAA